MVAGSAASRGIAALLPRPSGTASTVPLFSKFHGVGANRNKPAAQPDDVEERPDQRETNEGQHGPEEWTRNPWDHIHISNNAQGW